MYRPLFGWLFSHNALSLSRRNDVIFCLMTPCFAPVLLNGSFFFSSMLFVFCAGACAPAGLTLVEYLKLQLRASDVLLSEVDVLLRRLDTLMA